MRRLFARHAFTLVEVMVVVTVTAILSGIVLLYNSSSRAQIALFTEKVKIAQVMLRSKSLAISTYSDETTPCGYGLFVEPGSRRYSLVRYAPTDCTTLDRVDTTAVEPRAGEQYTLPPSLAFENLAGSLRYVIFVPPDPRVLLADANGTLLTQPSGTVTVQSTDDQFRAVITVNTAGQVTF